MTFVKTFKKQFMLQWAPCLKYFSLHNKVLAKLRELGTQCHRKRKYQTTPTARYTIY